MSFGQQNQHIDRTIIMQRSVLSQVQIINPLIKLVKERQELYFELLSFVSSHLTSSSNDLDNTSVFNKFIANIDPKHAALAKREQQFLESLADQFAEESQAEEDSISKQMLRLFLRLLQILEASLERVRWSVFEEGGRAVREHKRFQTTFNKIIKQEFFVAKDFAHHVLNYTTNKYNRQAEKIRKYVHRVQQGDDIWFKELYAQEKQPESSPSPDEKKHRDDQKTVKKLFKKIDMDKHLSSTEEPEKKAINLKNTARPKRKISKNRSKEYEEDDNDEPTKKRTANKLLQFYIPLELNKRQFLEDHIFQKANEERHKRELFNKLIQRNKVINSQINTHVRRSTHYLPVPIPIIAAKSSGDERYQSNASKASLRKSFVISRRKNSHNNFETSTEKIIRKNSDSEKKEMNNTIRNIQPRRRSSHSTTRQKSKKLVVIKTPMVFEEEIIPQAQITQTQWLQAPLTVKTKDRRNQNIRFKRKANIVNPMEGAMLQENFRYPL